MEPNEMLNQIERDFTYHPPKAEGEGQFAQAPRYEEIRDQAKDFMKNLAHLCPQSRELSLSKTKLEECVFWANAAIARNE